MKNEDTPNVKVRIWMLRNNISMVKIAKSYGSGRTFVSQFIQGVRTSKGLTKFMIGMGCPKECFKNGRIGD